MTATTSNGRARKSLAEQIDRLDRTLDGLADGLHEAVAAAVREAVVTVLTEIFSRPELLAKLQPVAAPIQAQGKPVTTVLREKLGRAWGRITTVLRAACAAYLAFWFRVGELGQEQGQRLAGKGWTLWTRTRQGMARTWRSLRIVRPLGLPLLGAIAAGALAGIIAYHAEPWLAAALSGVGGFATALAVQGWLWLRRRLAWVPQPVE